MTARSPRASKAAIDRALKALKDTGHTISGIELRPDGSLLILTGEPKAPLSPLEEWRRTQKGSEEPDWMLTTAEIKRLEREAYEANQAKKRARAAEREARNPAKRVKAPDD